MRDLFISYSRDNGAFVKRLHEALERRELEAWVDWEGIPPTAEWLREVYGAIDASQAFVFVLSRASISSEVCGKELERALAQNKRLVPIVREELTAESAPEALAKLNWIFLRDQDDFDSGIDTLVESLNTDLDRVKAHTRLLVRAVEWDSRQQHHSPLLRSRDLEEGEKRFVGEADKDPNPIALQLRFVRASRRRSTRLQRLVLGSVTLAGLVATALAVSPDGAHVASADGSAVRLWTVEGDKGRQTADGFHGHGNTVSTLAFDPAGRQVISGSHDNSIRIWDLGGNPLGEPLLGHDSWIRSLAVSAEGREIVSAGNDGTVRRWELSRSLSTRSCADTEGTASVLAVDNAGTSLIQRRGDDHRFEIYLQNRECDRSPVAVVDQVHVAAMTPDGRVVAYGALCNRTRWISLWGGDSDRITLTCSG